MRLPRANCIPAVGGLRGQPTEGDSDPLAGGSFAMATRAPWGPDVGCSAAADDAVKRWVHRPTQPGR
jgi:hypothetical protein